MLSLPKTGAAKKKTVAVFGYIYSILSKQTVFSLSLSISLSLQLVFLIDIKCVKVESLVSYSINTFYMEFSTDF